MGLVLAAADSGWFTLANGVVAAVSAVAIAAIGAWATMRGRQQATVATATQTELHDALAIVERLVARDGERDATMTDLRQQLIDCLQQAASRQPPRRRPRGAAGPE